MKIVINAYVHSVIDYGLEIWAVQSHSELELLQCRINRFLLEFFCPSHYKKRRKLHVSNSNSVNSVNNLLNTCNFLTITEKRDFVSLKLAFRDFEKGKLELSNRDNRTFPLIKVKSHVSESFKKCISFRICKL
jgi:hypothetical protein